jgi:serine phosphatase RsbU (regulator of sigma subunit)
MTAFQSADGLAPEEILQSLSSDLVRFTGGSELTDDLTFLLMSVDAR